MNAERLLGLYDRIADAADAIARLRRFVLDLAVRGKLVRQDLNEEPAAELLMRIAAEKSRLVKSGEFREPSNFARIKRNDLPFVPASHWVWVRLIDIARPSYGFAFSSEQFNSLKRGMPLIRIRDISSPDTEAYFDGDYDPAYVVKAGDYVVGMDGDFNLRLWKGKDGLLNQRVMRINGWRCDIEPEYVKLPLQMILDHLHGETSLTTVKHLSAKQVNGIEIPLPPLSEQRRIVAKVNELMTLCDELEAARTEREVTRDRLTAASLARLNGPDPETFRDDARFALGAMPALTARADQIKQLRQTILNLAVRGSLGGAPQGELKQVGAFRSLQNGYAFKSEWFSRQGIRLLRNANIGHGEIRWGDVAFLPPERAKEFERFLLNEGDIVLTLDRPFIVTGTKVARIMAADIPSLLLQRVGRFVETRPGLSDKYLFIWINSPQFNEQIDPGRSNGVPHISSKQVEAAKIIVPSLAEQHRIVAKVDELMALCDRLEASLTTADDTRRRLLEALLAEALAPNKDTKLKAAE
ncbi:MAG TPA: restriction endonuclease subunit S [Micropepsaceae bacterium]|nr:restriction endonuclease subunit S [Micropepsaceae bacterium]